MTARNSAPRQMTPAVRSRPRFLVSVLVLLLILVAVALVIASPYALDVFGKGREWRERSEIGQTYGAAAALLSVLALVGISASLILQAREAKVAREHASRVTHSELLQMAMDDPAYRECWGPVDPSRSERELRQHAYTNLIVSYWQSRFEIGTFNEAHLRAGAAAMFAGAPGRRFWATARSDRHATAQTRRMRRFNAILDDEYAKAVDSGPPAEQLAPGRVRHSRQVPGAVLAGAGGAAALRLLYRALARRRRT
jgi:hypothetical protein